jgi:hypothetical protein
VNPVRSILKRNESKNFGNGSNGWTFAKRYTKTYPGKKNERKAAAANWTICIETKKSLHAMNNSPVMSKGFDVPTIIIDSV